MRYIAFLRAINVGGHTVKMDALRGHFEALGLNHVETFIASGNVVFESKAKDIDKLRRKIEAHLHQALSFEVATFIRSEQELLAIARYQAFTPAALDAAAAHNVAFLAEPLSDHARKLLMDFKNDIDDFHVHGREVYWLCLKKQSESTFSNVRMEKALKISATFRGMNTIVKLAAKLEVVS